MGWGRMYSTSQFWTRVSDKQQTLMLRLSKDMVKLVCYPICINGPTLKEASSNGTRDFRKAVSDFDINDNQHKSYHSATSDLTDRTNFSPWLNCWVNRISSENEKKRGRSRKKCKIKKIIIKITVTVTWIQVSFEWQAMWWQDYFSIIHSCCSCIWTEILPDRPVEAGSFFWGPLPELLTWRPIHKAVEHCQKIQSYRSWWP